MGTRRREGEEGRGDGDILFLLMPELAGARGREPRSRSRCQAPRIRPISTQDQSSAAHTFPSDLDDATFLNQKEKDQFERLGEANSDHSLVSTDLCCVAGGQADQLASGHLGGSLSGRSGGG